MHGTQRPGLHRLALERRPLLLPIASYPGAQRTGATVRQLTTDPHAQTDAILALHRHLRTEVLLTCMDLSAEAEAFGATVHAADDEEVPSITGSLITSLAQAEALAVPEVGRARTGIQGDVVRALAAAAPDRLILAGATGPFSLAARLLGVSEALVLTLQEPDLVHRVLEKCVTYLTASLRALRDAGAGGVILAEPTAGLLSPRGLETFSAAAVRTLVEAVESPSFSIVLHNCGAKPVHLPALLKSGVRVFHFGAPMDLDAALRLVPADTLIAGNLDPAKVFNAASPETTYTAARDFLHRHAHRPNVILSSGCDLPRRTPLAHLEAFFAAARDAQGLPR